MTANSAGAWTQNITFEGGIGASDGISFAGSTFTQSAESSQSGIYSAKVHFPAGDTCYDPSLTCGAYLAMPSSVGNGGELWTRVYMYFPAGWDWGDQDGTGQWRKLLRYQVDGRGRIGVGGVWPGGAATTCEIVGNTEAGNNYTYASQFTGVNFPVGRWIAVEQYVKLGTTDETSRQLIWLDGILIFDNKDIPSDNPFLGSESDIISTVMIFTYWNGKVRTAQDAFVDNIIMTTDTPSHVDASGNKMIGPDGWLSGKRYRYLSISDN